MKRLLAFMKHLVIFLITLTVLSALWFLDNPTKFTKPRPKAFLAWKSYHQVNKSMNRTIISGSEQQLERKALLNVANVETVAKPPFDYLKTTLWGKEHVSSWTRVYGDLNCAGNKKRNAINEIIKTWNSLAQKYDIHYAFVYGSLIGIVRNNDIIPWDHDVDVYVEYKDVLKLEKAGWPRDVHITKNKTIVNYIPNSEHGKPVGERIRWDCKGRASPRSTDQCAIQEPLVRLYNNGAFLDVLDYRIRTHTIEMVSEGRVFITKKEHYFPTRRCMFMGFHGWCPNDPKAMLASYYGKHFLVSDKRCKNGQWVKVRKKG